MKKPTTEWDRWAQQFRVSKKCIIAVQEYSHKVACGEPATHKTHNCHRLPCCERHQNFNGREEWKGFIEGA